MKKLLLLAIIVTMFSVQANAQTIVTGRLTMAPTESSSVVTFNGKEYLMTAREFQLFADAGFITVGDSVSMILDESRITGLITTVTVMRRESFEVFGDTTRQTIPLVHAKNGRLLGDVELIVTYANQGIRVPINWAGLRGTELLWAACRMGVGRDRELPGLEITFPSALVTPMPPWEVTFNESEKYKPALRVLPLP